MTRGALYHHFEDKQALFRAVPGRTRLLLLNGPAVLPRLLDARRALEIGLVNRVAPAEELARAALVALIAGLLVAARRRPPPSRA